MATSITTHVSEYVLGQDDSKSGEIARDLHAKTITLVQLVESLGEHLTSTDVSRRRRGTQLLVDVIQQLPSSLLSEQEVSHVVMFMMSRLADHHSIQPLALSGLARLTNFSEFGGGQLTRDVVSAVFKEVQNQGMNQADRRATFTIMINLLTLHLPDLLPMGDTFVYGFIQQMDGEKDPRNLMLAFRSSLIICTHFNLGSMEEEMFEVTSCYFPVDFVPKPDDPTGITREDLRSALCAVMSASPMFAKYCYPLLLEKLESEGMSAKLDVLNTLVACLKVYKPKDFQDFFPSFYTLMIKEIRDGFSEELVTACLQALTAMATQLTQLPGLLEDFMADKGALMVKQVESDNLALRQWSSRVLVAMAAANGRTCHAVAARLLPAVCSLCLNLTAQLDRHTPFLTEFVALLNYITVFHSSITDWTLLQPCRHKLREICDILVSKNGHSSIQTLGLQGLCALSCWNGVYFAQEIVDTMTKLTDFALSVDNDTLREESSKAVKKAVEIQKHRADIVINKLKTTLYSNLQKSKVEPALSNACHLLGSVCVDGDTAASVATLLVTTLQEQTSGHEEAMVWVSASLRDVMTSSHLSTEELTLRVLPSLLTYLGWGKEGVCGDWPIDKQAEHKAVIANISAGLKAALKAADGMTQQQIVQQVMYALVDSSSGDGTRGSLLFMDEECPWQKTRLVQLLLVVLPYSDVMRMVWALPELSALAIKVEDPVTHEHSCRCVATIFNLMPPGPHLESQVSELAEQLNFQFDSCFPIKGQERTVTLLAFLTKAMVVRGHRLANDLISKLIKLLVHPKLGLKTSECFPLIVRKFPDFLCAEDSAVVSPVFQQRFLLQTLPTLTAEFKACKLDPQGEYILLAVMGMLPHLPQQVLLDELPKLRKMVIMGLTGLNAELQMEALKVVAAGLENKSSFAKFDMRSLLQHCLTLATKGNTMMVRLQALKCVGLLGELPDHDMADNKNWVLSALKGPLDDPKRLVRKAAVDARMIWYLL